MNFDVFPKPQSKKQTPYEIHISATVFLCMSLSYRSSKPFRPDLHNLNLWEITTGKWRPLMSRRKSYSVSQVEMTGHDPWKDYEFSEGMRVDVKGKNIPQQSFVGLLFIFQDAKKYEFVYFRPFNFMNADTLRRSPFSSVCIHAGVSLGETESASIPASMKISKSRSQSRWTGFHVGNHVNGKQIKSLCWSFI